MCLRRFGMGGEVGEGGGAALLVAHGNEEDGLQEGAEVDSTLAVGLAVDLFNVGTYLCGQCVAVCNIATEVGAEEHEAMELAPHDGTDKESVAVGVDELQGGCILLSGSGRLLGAVAVLQDAEETALGVLDELVTVGFAGGGSGALALEKEILHAQVG